MNGILCRDCWQDHDTVAESVACDIQVRGLVNARSRLLSMGLTVEQVDSLIRAAS